MGDRIPALGATAAFEGGAEAGFVVGGRQQDINPFVKDSTR